MHNNLIELFIMVFMLGFKHGIDPDHLIAIDGITRFNAQKHPHISLWTGFLFSLGHGAIVVVSAALLGLMAAHWQIPHWTEAAGAWVSIIVLFLLGILNLAGLLRTSSNQVYEPIGLKGHFLARFFNVSNPFVIFCIGALFAVSFDTLSQVMLFTAAISKSNGWLYAASLGMVFAIGMISADTTNGFWISKVMRRADRQAQALSRIIGGLVAGLSLAIGSVELIQVMSPTFAAQIEQWQIIISISILLVSFIFQTLIYFKFKSRQT